MLFKRQEILLNTINFLSKKNTSKIYLEKSLFLLKKEYLSEKINFYSFYPYKYGPFSRLSYLDKTYLVKEELLDKNETELTKKGKQYLEKQNISYDCYLEEITKRFNTNKKIKEYVYEKYPEYTIKSELIEHKNKVKLSQIFTIGYEKKNIDEFLYKLIKEDIDVVVDVRKVPYSMNYTYIGKKLNQILNNPNTNIKYIHMPELGIDSENRQNLKEYLDYKKLFINYEKKLQETKLQEKLKDLEKLSKNNKIALMCFEKDPLYCHRGIIANYFRNKGVEVIDL